MLLPYSCGTVAAGACGADPPFRCHTAQSSRASRAAVLPYHFVSHWCASRLLMRCLKAPFYYVATLVVRAICSAGQTSACRLNYCTDRRSFDACRIDAHFAHEWSTAPRAIGLLWGIGVDAGYSGGLLGPPLAVLPFYPPAVSPFALSFFTTCGAVASPLHRATPERRAMAYAAKPLVHRGRRRSPGSRRPRRRRLRSRRLRRRRPRSKSRRSSPPLLFPSHRGVAVFLLMVVKIKRLE